MNPTLEIIAADEWGEAVGGRHVGYGDGVYRSLDGGKSFQNVGLKESEHIAKILVDPRDSSVVLVASQGPLWSAGGERGLYKTTDGGETWQQILAGGEYTGVTDLVLDPRDPDVIYASTYQRRRRVWTLLDGGPMAPVRNPYPLFARIRNETPRSSLVFPRGVGAIRTTSRGRSSSWLHRPRTT